MLQFGAIPRSWLTCSALLMLPEGPSQEQQFHKNILTLSKTKATWNQAHHRDEPLSSQTQGDPETIKSWGWETRFPASGLNYPPLLPPWPLKMRPNPTHTLPKSFSQIYLLLPVDLEKLFYFTASDFCSQPRALSQLKRKQHLKERLREGGRWEQQGTECWGSASVLPSCWESAILPPTHECGCSWELWSRT